jgi:hypothetical protein
LQALFWAADLEAQVDYRGLVVLLELEPQELGLQQELGQ